MDRCPKCGGTNGYQCTMTERHSMSGFWGEVPESQDSTIIYHSTVATCVDCHATFPFDESRRPTPRALDGAKSAAEIE